MSCIETSSRRTYSCTGEVVDRDFGVAMFAAAAPATHTHKGAFSGAYAAPEQWEHREVTAKTDIYAFGVMACEIPTGSRPFEDAEGDEAALRREHCERDFPLEGFAPPVVSLVAQCLMKQPSSRPSAAAALARLDRLDDPRASLPGLQDLDTANHAISRRLDEHERLLAVERRESERFNQLFEDAQHPWIQLSYAFVEAITASVDVGASRYGSGQWQLRIGPGCKGDLWIPGERRPRAGR